MATNDELIKQLYKGETPASVQIAQNAAASNLEAQKAGLEADYNKAIANLDQQKADTQKAADANMNAAAVDAQKQQRNFSETANAYGLTSGAVAQAKLAQDNAQLQAMATQRAKQQETEAQIERQRGVLSDQYAAAIREAQAKNDYNLAQQLYATAKEQEKNLNQAKAANTYSGGGAAAVTQDINSLFAPGTATTAATTAANAARKNNTVTQGVIEKGASANQNQEAIDLARTAINAGESPESVRNALVMSGVSVSNAMNAISRVQNENNAGTGRTGKF